MTAYLNHSVRVFQSLVLKSYLKNLVTIWTKEVVLKVAHFTLPRGTLEQWHCAWVFADHIIANCLCILSVHEIFLCSLHCC